MRAGPLGVGIAPSWEKPAFVALVLFAIAFGWLVLDRSAFSDRRRTDAGVFFRAGWAVREGVNPHTVPDENDWYFLYPPGMAVFMVPLSDPPADKPREGHLPYPVSVVLWYALSVACVVASVRWIAAALEERAASPEVRAITPASGGWWNLRFWPLMLCLPDFGSTLSRGQVNVHMLALICLGTLLIVRGRSLLAGGALAAAACIKVFPGIFVFYVLARRDGRALAGYAACGVALMVVLPLVAFGPTRAFEYTKMFAEQVVLAGVGLADVPKLQAGSGFENTDNISVQGVLHNVTHIGTPRGQRPAEPAAWVQPVHALVGVGLLIATLAVGRVRSPRDGLDVVLRVGMLSCVMIAAVPMAHRHYMVFAFPAVAALVFANMQRSKLGTLDGWGWPLAIAYPLLLSLPRFEQQGVLRDLPIPLVVNLVVWGLCLKVVVSRRASEFREVAR